MVHREARSCVTSLQSDSTAWPAVAALQILTINAGKARRASECFTSRLLYTLALMI